MINGVVGGGGDSFDILKRSNQGLDISTAVIKVSQCKVQVISYSIKNSKVQQEINQFQLGIQNLCFLALLLFVWLENQVLFCCKQFNVPVLIALY